MFSRKTEEPLKFVPLPRSHWDFSDVSEQRLNLVFFEEYALQSRRMGDMIEWFCTTRFVERWIEHCTSRMRSDSKVSQEIQEFEALPFSEGIVSVAFGSQKFPHSGLLGEDCDAETLESSFNEESFVSIEHFGTDRDDICSAVFDEKTRGISVVDSDRSLPFMRTSGVGYHGCQNFLLSIPNHMSRKQILKMFGDALDSAWPYELKASYERSQEFLWLGSLELTFSKRTALTWLGVLRRFEHSGSSWVRYLKIYPESGDVESVKRKLREQCNKAREIVKWFDACGHGSVVSLNNSRTLVWTEGRGS